MAVDNAYIWRAAQDRLRQKTTNAQFETWLRGTQLVSVKNGVALLGAPTTFAKEQLETRFRPLIEMAIGEVLGAQHTLSIMVLGAAGLADTPTGNPSTASRTPGSGRVGRGSPSSAAYASPTLFDLDADQPGNSSISQPAAPVVETPLVGIHHHERPEETAPAKSSPASFGQRAAITTPLGRHRLRGRMTNPQRISASTPSTRASGGSSALTASSARWPASGEGAPGAAEPTPKDTDSARTRADDARRAARGQRTYPMYDDDADDADDVDYDSADDADSDENAAAYLNRGGDLSNAEDDYEDDAADDARIGEDGDDEVLMARGVAEREGSARAGYDDRRPSGGPVAPRYAASGGFAPPAGAGTRGAGGPYGLEAPRLNARYTFATFIVGSGNRLAHAASQAVAEAPGYAYNPLFLYGGVGLGKTHLLHAIGHTALQNNLTVLYVSSETFTNEIINAIRFRTTEEFRAKYRSVDVLLVDDIQFIAGKDSTEEEFFHTFNSLHESNKQIVICSDRPPAAIVSLEDRLRSRFAWGLIADIQPPDLETRIAILQAKAEGLRRRVPDDVILFLASRVQSNIRELEGSLNRLMAFAELQGAPLNVDTAKAALANLANDGRQRRVSVADILAAVAEHYHLPADDLRGKQRDKHIVTPRQVAMYLMRQETEASLLEIGQALGGRDHSTVLHGCEKISREINENTGLRKEVLAIRQKLLE